MHGLMREGRRKPILYSTLLFALLFGSVGIEHLPQSLGALTVRVFKPQMAATPATLESQEAEHIQHVLKLAEGNRSQAARMLGIDRVSLWRKLKKQGIDSK